MQAQSSLAVQAKVADTTGLAEQFKRDGYVVLEGVLPVDFVDQLHAEYLALLEAKIRRFGLAWAKAADDQTGKEKVLNDFRPEGGNHDVNRWNMHLPSRRPFLDERLIANPEVVELLDGVLAPDWLIYLIASDTPYPGAGFQNAHQDFTTLSIAVNIPLVDLTEDNGPMEIWPGTHRPDLGGPAEGYSKEPYVLSPEGMREVLATVPSKRPLLRRGSILVRDHRMVHRGTPNRSGAPRPMLSIYCVEPKSVPYRWMADLGARAALAMRRSGRGHGRSVQRQWLFGLGNVLGRVAEESSLSDRDYRRAIPADLWQSFSPRTRHLLRYATVDVGAEAPPPQGSLGGAWRFSGEWWGNVSEVIQSQVLGRPRRPDRQARVQKAEKARR